MLDRRVLSRVGYIPCPMYKSSEILHRFVSQLRTFHWELALPVCPPMHQARTATMPDVTKRSDKIQIVKLDVQLWMSKSTRRIFSGPSQSIGGPMYGVVSPTSRVCPTQAGLQATQPKVTRPHLHSVSCSCSAH